MIPLRSERPTSLRPARWIALAVALYWTASCLLGLLRLAHADWRGAAVGEVLTAWYVEALVFVAVWGGASCLAGLLAGQAEPVWRPQRRKLRHDPLKAASLAALERQRGR